MRPSAPSAQDARRAGLDSDIYYLWSLERVCVALGLRSLDGFDWYAHGASILLDRQDDDGGWPHDRWGRLPSTCLALLFLRKANLAFEIDRVLRLPGPASDARGGRKRGRAPSRGPRCQAPTDAGAPGSAAGLTAPEAVQDDVKVIVTGASEQSFPEISVQFEVKRPDGSFLLDAGRDDFRVTEEGRDVDVVDFQAPRTTEAIPTTVVLVVDRSLSMEEEDRIGGLKRAVHSFLEKLPDGFEGRPDRVRVGCRQAQPVHHRPRPDQDGRRRTRARGGDPILRRRRRGARDARS